MTASRSLKSDVSSAEPSRAASVQKVKSKSGIEAWLVEDYSVPLIAMEFAFKGGASQDPAGKPGVASLLAGLLDEGAGPYDSHAFHAVLDDYALEISFSADRDILSGHMQTLARHADKAFELLRLCVNDARLDDEPIERVKSQIAAGLKREINDPDYAASRVFRTQAYPGHPYGAPVRGELETLESLTQADLKAMRTASFARNGLKIAVVGAIDAATLARHIDEVFSALPAKATLIEVPNVAVAGVGTLHVIDLDVPQSTIRFGRQGLMRTDADFIPATVVNHVLGGGVFSARLFREVREKRGLAYSVYSQLVTFDHGAMLSGGTSTKNERAAESMEVIKHEIRSLADKGPSADELDKAKKFLIGSYALRFDTSTKIASQLLHLQTDGYDVDFLDQRNRLIAAVSTDDAKRAAQRLLDKGELLVVVAGRPERMG
jgi:zinc protease